MSQLEITPFVFSASALLMQDALPNVWARWSALSTWQDWDASLIGTEAHSDGLELGKRFRVVPKASPSPILVSVTALVEDCHFTTTATGATGIISFGHTLKPASNSAPARVIHTVCALPSDPELFAAHMWERFQNDVRQSVGNLAHVVEQEAIA